MSAFPPSAFGSSEDAQGASWQTTTGGQAPRRVGDGQTETLRSADHFVAHEWPIAPSQDPLVPPGAQEASTRHGSPESYRTSVSASHGQSNWPATHPTNTLAVISLVTGLLCFSIISVILGHIALGQIKRTGENGATLAIIGLVLGYLQIIAGVFLVLIFGLGMFWAVSS